MIGIVPRCWIVLLTLCTLAPFSLAKTGAELSIVAQAKSDWVYHGTSETSGEAAVGINIEYQLNQRLFVGLEAHEGQVETLQQRHRGIAAYIGADQTLNEHWDAVYSIKHRVFPGSVIDWDYTELSLLFAHRSGWTLQLDHAQDYYDQDTAVVVAEATYSRNVTPRWYWYAGAGRVELARSAFPDYGYAQAGGGYSRGSFNVDLGYQWNSNNGRRLFGPDIESAQWLATLTYRLR